MKRGFQIKSLNNGNDITLTPTWHFFDLFSLDVDEVYKTNIYNIRLFQSHNKLMGGGKEMLLTQLSRKDC